MGGPYQRGVGQQFLQQLVDLVTLIRGQVRRGFVEEYHQGTEQQQASEGEALALASGEHGRIVHGRGQALFQRREPVPEPHAPDAGANGFVAVQAQADIHGHGAGKQRRFLLQQQHLVPQRGEGGVGSTADSQRSMQLSQPCQRFEEGGLARARRPAQQYAISRFQFQVIDVQQFVALQREHRGIVDPEGERPRSGLCILRWRRRVSDDVTPGRGSRQGVAATVIELSQDLEFAEERRRYQEQKQRLGERGPLTVEADANLAEQGKARKHGDQGDGQGREKVQHGAGQEGHAEHRREAIVQGFAGAGKAFYLHRPGVVESNRLPPQKAIAEETAQAIKGQNMALLQRDRTLAHEPHEQGYQGHGGDEHERREPADGQDQQQHQHRQRGDQPALQAIVHEVGFQHRQMAAVKILPGTEGFAANQYASVQPQALHQQVKEGLLHPLRRRFAQASPQVEGEEQQGKEQRRDPGEQRPGATVEPALHGEARTEVPGEKQQLRREGAGPQRGQVPRQLLLYAAQDRLAIRGLVSPLGGFADGAQGFCASSEEASRSAVASSHSALMMPKLHARSTPRIQVKYHIAISLVDSATVAALHIAFTEASPHDVEAPGCIDDDQGDEERGHPEHDFEGVVAARGVPQRQ